MRIALVSVAGVLLAACSTGGATGGNRPYAAPARPSPAPQRAYAAPASRPGAGGYDAQDVSLATALAGGRAAGRPVALYCYSAGCGWCRKLEGETLPDPSVRAEMANFYNVRESAESPAGREVLGRYGIHAFPTVLFPDAAGGRRKPDIGGYSQPVNFSSRLRQSR